MTACEDQIVTYRKTNPSEVINVGDLIMLDPDTNYVTKTTANNMSEYIINSRLIIGVCISSNNKVPVTGIIDAGSSSIVDIERQLLDGGTSNNDADKPTVIIIDGGTSEQNKREIIQIAYTGKQLVNIYGYANLGDKLTMSKQPGKAQTLDYLTNNFYVRTIGKVIQYTSNPEQVKVLLDIE